MATKKKLSAVELKRYAQILEEERKRIKLELKKIIGAKQQVLAESTKGENAEEESIGDSASEASEVLKMNALEENLHNILNRIELALSKIKDKSYGICANCGVLIDKARLKVMPYAVLCIKCKAKQEKDLK